MAKILTISEIESGLASPRAIDRWRMVSQPNIKLSDNQIEKCLVDSAEFVRSAVASNKKFKMSAKQVERGLLDDAFQVRYAFATRLDFKPTIAQINRGLKDSEIGIVKFFEQKKNELTAKYEAVKLLKIGGVNKRDKSVNIAL